MYVNRLKLELPIMFFGAVVLLYVFYKMFRPIRRNSFCDLLVI